jgi:nitroimidazol reductase NimA-like FMN-containing flavoprotein (pyridoxamine 5'-phosphate oxidase superfamily)
MHVDRSGLEILSREECLALLETATIGRIAVTVDALPVVLPVNFAVSGGTVVISTAPGTKLHAATRRSVVGFEVDAIDPLYHAGWSVLVTGTAEEIVDPVEIAAARRLPLRAWGLGESADIHYVRIEATLISGRRLAATPALKHPAVRS